MAEISKESNTLDDVRPSDLKEWSSDDVASWMVEKKFTEEAQLLKAEGVTGKALLELDKDSLKEAGIVALGRRLEMMNEIKALKETCAETPEEANTSVLQPLDNGTIPWIKKICQTDKASWKPSQRNLYNSRTAIIIKEAKAVWKGNGKVYFKHNEANRLKLEELTTKLNARCAIPEIGFGQDAIRSHILQWASEKNRRLSDGYDYEAERKPAKRARLVQSSTGTDTETTNDDDDLDDNCASSDAKETSSSILDMSRQSALSVILEAFAVNSIRDLSVKQHLLPLGKLLSVKCRGLGKYQMIIPLAQKLITKKYVIFVEGQNVNFVHLSRSILERKVDVAKLINKETRDQSLDSDFDTSSGSTGSTVVDNLEE